MTDQPGPAGGFRVRIVRDAQGKIYGFQDPDRGNRFIKRSEALKGLRRDPTTGQLADSFGNTAGVGAIAFPASGVQITTPNFIQDYERLETHPRYVRPTDRQEIIERLVLQREDGKLISVETSYRLGNKFDPQKRGGWWRKAASDALGLAPGERLPTEALQRAVVSKEYLLKTTRSR